jgi:DNA excision repair protein ERCC-1
MRLIPQASAPPRLSPSHRSHHASLKYHRLHPEYIYQRIRNLQGKYNVRILLTMVDIPNHEDPLRELAKTALVYDVTLVLCWSAAEAARYLELYKSYEHANFSAIRGQQSSSYAEKLVDFVTVPRSVNKADAIALVSNFGTLKDAINADSGEINLIGGWGSTKVKKWVAAVEEPFRVQKAAKRKIGEVTGEEGTSTPSRLDGAVPIGRVPLREMQSYATSSTSTPAEEAGPSREKQRPETAFQDDEEAMIALAIEESQKTAEAEARQRSKAGESSSSAAAEELTDGVAAALARLREKG